MKAVLFLIVLTILVGEYIYFDSRKNQPNARTVPTVTPTEVPEDLNTSENILAHVQDYRLKNNKPPYIESDFLCSIANSRLEETIKNWSHSGFYYSKYCNDCYLGENLARNYLFADQTMNGWIDSPTHKANLDRNYTHTCIATDGTNVVQIFGYY